MCDEVLISIIVPIYNVQQYLEECLNSIISQQFEAYEVLLIDDGSTDDSASICKKYVNQDYRFKYYYNKMVDFLMQEILAWKERMESILCSLIVMIILKNMH